MTSIHRRLSTPPHLDGRPQIVEELTTAEDDIREYLADAFGRLLLNEDFLDSIPGHLPPDTGSQMRSGILRDRLEAIASLAALSAPEGTPEP